MIEFRNINKKFKDTFVIENMNLTIQSGELVSLLGPSGCGKSTTLFMLAGIHQPTSGKIYIGGRDISQLSPLERNVGMVFQDYALYPHMTVFDNIAFPLKINKLSKKVISEKVLQVAHQVEIEALLKRKPNELSGGQQQRVAIARAIVREPNLLLLDEPLSNLDARLRITMRDEIRELQQRLKITTLFVTHDQEEALSISDKIIMMDRGKIIQYGTPQNIYDHPHNKFVASFIGHPPMNLLDLNAQQRYLINRDINANKHATIGIRPEHLLISEEGYPVKVKRKELLGKDTLIIAEDESNNILKVFSDKDVKAGDTLNLTAEINHIKIFD